MASAGSIAIHDSIRAVWPNTHLGCIWYTVFVQPHNAALWEYFEKDTAPMLQEQLVNTPLAKMPEIAPSRAAFKAFGVDPGRYRLSSEALYRRIRQGKSLYQINSLVDANNLISLITGFSLGTYDAARIGSEIVFRPGQQDESYSGIGKGAVPLTHVPLLADRDGPFGCPVSDSQRARVTEGTLSGLTIIYSFSGRETLATALNFAEQTLARFADIHKTQAAIL